MVLCLWFRGSGKNKSIFKPLPLLIEKKSIKKHKFDLSCLGNSKKEPQTEDCD